MLLEKEDQPGYHASGRSVAFYLEIYGNETVRLLTLCSGDFFPNPPAGLGDHLLGKQRGDLCIAGADQVERLHREYRELSRLSTQITLEDVGETFYFKSRSGELLLSPADETPTEPGDVQALGFTPDLVSPARCQN